MLELENSYQQSLSPVLEKATALGKIDLIVGIPFLRMSEEAQEEAQIVLSVLEAGLDTFYPELKALIICAVSSAVVPSITGSFVQKDRILITQLPNNQSGRGWAVRSLMDMAHRLTADLLILDHTLLRAKRKDSPEGLTPDWIKLMYQPVRDGHAAFVLPRFKLSHLTNTIGDHLIFPLLATFYNLELQGCPDAAITISRSLLPAVINDAPDWTPEIYDHGIGYWLLMRVLELKADIAEVFLGHKPKTALPVGIDYIFRQVAHAVFQGIGKTQDTWKKIPRLCALP